MGERERQIVALIRNILGQTSADQRQQGQGDQGLDTQARGIVKQAQEPNI